MRKELEERLVNLCLKIDHLRRHLEDGYLSEHLTKQIIRSSTSAALNYGEAQGAESKGDFIHKISIILEDLRETQISLKLLFSGYKPHFPLQQHVIQAYQVICPGSESNIQE